MALEGLTHIWKLVLAVSWTMRLQEASMGFVTWEQCSKRLSPNAQMLFKPQLMSQLLIFHWSKKVSMAKPYINVEGDYTRSQIQGDVLNTGRGPYCNNTPYLRYWDSLEGILSVSCPAELLFILHNHNWTVLLKHQLFCHPRAQLFSIW